MKFFSIPYKRVRKIEKANLLCVGSNLDKIVNNAKAKKHKITVVGAGFIEPNTEVESITNKLEIYALRGKLSKERMQNILNKDLSNVLLADAGILVNKVYPQIKKQKYKLGIIPHYYDKELLNLNSILLDKSSYTVIDIQQDVEIVTKQICECECILSSSLHGLIFSDSYDIPNRQLIICNKIAGGCYKFEDYYSAFGLELPNPINLKYQLIDEDVIQEIEMSYVSKDIEPKQKKLVALFNGLRVNNG
jgi:pyruvyltransferase